MGGGPDPGLRALATRRRWPAVARADLFVPLVVLGALLGDLCGLAVHEPTHTLFPVIGVAAFLGAGSGLPLAAVVFVAEATGRPGFIVPGLIAAVAAQLVMGDESVSVYQHIGGGPRLRRRSPRRGTPRCERRCRWSSRRLSRRGGRTHLGHAQHSTMPVVDGQRYLGLIRLEDLRERPGADWPTTQIGAVVPPGQPAVGPGWSLEEVAQAMATTDRNVLGVVDEAGRFVGLVTAADLVGLDDFPDGQGDGRPDEGD